MIRLVGGFLIFKRLKLIKSKMSNKVSATDAHETCGTSRTWTCVERGTCMGTFHDHFCVGPKPGNRDDENRKPKTGRHALKFKTPPSPRLQQNRVKNNKKLRRYVTSTIIPATVVVVVHLSYGDASLGRLDNRPGPWLGPWLARPPYMPL